jgi:23S rRNA pseudouridine1911/1915/1917 synthase
MPSRLYHVAEPFVGERLDVFLAQASHLSRAEVQRLLKAGGVSPTVAGTCAELSASYRVRLGEAFTLEEASFASSPQTLEPYPMALEILFEDADLLVLNKPAGCTVHPGAGTREPTLVQGILAHTRGALSNCSDPTRPGIVHRLDKETSGVLVAAKTNMAHRGLAQQFAQHTLLRSYVAFCWGKPSPLSGEIQAAIGRHPIHRQKQALRVSGGKFAHTLYQVHRIFSYPLSTEIHCTLRTGRTHQVRVHLSEGLHCPLIGDPLYTRKRSCGTTQDARLQEIFTFPRQALHAITLDFFHPVTGRKLAFTTPLPPDLARLKKLLEMENPSKYRKIQNHQMQSEEGVLRLTQMQRNQAQLEMRKKKLEELKEECETSLSKFEEAEEKRKL